MLNDVLELTLNGVNMIDKERIKKEADSFFEWSTNDKSTVSTESMLIFCNVIAEMARNEERESIANEAQRTWRCNN